MIKVTVWNLRFSISIEKKEGNMVTWLISLDLVARRRISTIANAENKEKRWRWSDEPWILGFFSVCYNHLRQRPTCQIPIGHGMNVAVAVLAAGNEALTIISSQVLLCSLTCQSLCMVSKNYCTTDLILTTFDSLYSFLSFRFPSVGNYGRWWFGNWFIGINDSRFRNHN